MIIIKSHVQLTCPPTRVYDMSCSRKQRHANRFGAFVFERRFQRKEHTNPLLQTLRACRGWSKKQGLSDHTLECYAFNAILHNVRCDQC